MRFFFKFINIIFVLIIFSPITVFSFEVRGIIKSNEQTFNLSKINFSSNDLVQVRFEIDLKKNDFLEINAFKNKRFNLLKKQKFNQGKYYFPGESNWFEIDLKNEVKIEFIFEKQKKEIFFKKFENSFNQSLFKKKEIRSVKAGSNIKKKKIDLSMLRDELPNYKFEKTRNDGVKIFKKYSDSVVYIQNQDSFGSGSVISDDGTILTNWHVIQNARMVKVFQKPGNFKKIDKSKALVADVIKINQTLDLALLKLRSIPINILPIKLGNIDDVIIASDVHAIGHPQGNTWSYTKGTISQVRSDFEWESSSVLHIADTIQTQTPISPGNSGGPLLDKNGKLIGVNSFIDSSNQSQNINYAISISSINEFIKSEQRFVEAKTKNSYKEERLSDTEMLLDLDNDGTFESYSIDNNNDGKPDEIRTDLDNDKKFDQFAEDLNFDGIVDRIATFVKMQDGKEVLIIETDTNKDGEIDHKDNKFADYDLDGKVDEVFPGNV